MTGHDRFTGNDYELLRPLGIRTVREAVRWHLVEERRGVYDFSSLEHLLRSAHESGTELILDLLHFGWPDHLDVLSTEFPVAFGRFSAAVARYLRDRSAGPFFVAPVNEISFLSWAGGEVAGINPYLTGISADLKRNLIRAAITGSEILLNELPNVRLISPEPVIHIVGQPGDPVSAHDAENYRRCQFEVWDMLSGRSAPELGGRAEYLDILGTNFYDRNEWVHNGRCLERGDPLYRPFSEILTEVWARYGRPVFVSETGTEDGGRAEWFTYVCDEVAAALDQGVPVNGICLYPILNHPGWDDDRHCHNGLFDYPDEQGIRNTHWPLLQAIRTQQRRFGRSTETSHGSYNDRHHLPLSSTLGLRLSTSSAPNEQVCAHA